MSNLQKVIKYFAMGFAVFLAVCIIWGITSTAIAIVSVVTGETFFDGGKNRVDFNESFKEVESLDIDGSFGDVYIKTGETFRVEAENVTNDFKARVSSTGRLMISEEKFKFPFFIFSQGKSKVTIYLPEDFTADNVKLDCGVGDVQIDALYTEELSINAGIGDIDGTNVKADKVKIDGGIGDLKLSNVIFEDVNIDSGIGDVELIGELYGYNAFDSGIGEINIKIKGHPDDYDFNVDSGIGSVRVNDKKISGIITNVNSEHTVKVNGGIGGIRIDFFE
ncbi:DUF4097 family beta strand repeat protein [Mobilitalea sibirica]|uniref:DUF4097 family beta strand repeat protein n=1 Tax=Mobilitalea sibirica TaxID=1462919 RepID=A0A8J7H8Q8_9FIRM|nr:DUF4097 family beta strand repeat-containing protein [Mobilitalea sibirica]MBH1940445.1 DUF4097 family beta strand repeat protein [Mobilitalea sibirica]